MFFILNKIAILKLGQEFIYFQIILRKPITNFLQGHKDKFVKGYPERLWDYQHTILNN